MSWGEGQGALPPRARRSDRSELSQHRRTLRRSAITRRRARRALLVTGVLPGAGGLLLGSARRAVLTLLALLVLVGSAILLVRQQGGVIATATSPTALGWLLVLNLGAVALRLSDLAATARAIPTHPLPTAERARRSRRSAVRTTITSSTVAAALTLLVVPHVVLGWALVGTRSAVQSTFPVEHATTEVLGTVVTKTPPQTTDSPDVPVVTAADPGGDVPAEAPADGVVPSDGTFDLVLIGLDSGDGRTGARNDATMVVSVDVETAHTTLIGLPRNLIRVPLPSSTHPCRCFPEPLYALYRFGENHAEVDPDALDTGASLVAEAAGALTGLEVDGYLVADMQAFREIVAHFGGVTLDIDEYIDESLPDPLDRTQRVSVDVAPGRHHLDEDATLAYVRGRAGSSDYVRMERQRCVVRELSRPLDGLSATEVATLAWSTSGQVISDVPREHLPWLVDLAREVDPGAIASLGLTPPDFTAKRIDGYHVPDLEAMHTAVAAARARGAMPLGDQLC
jgi:polyisoprenyl-teichoic acid--peptidoglycan teichoic acid transferase